MRENLFGSPFRTVQKSKNPVFLNRFENKFKHIVLIHRLKTSLFRIFSMVPKKSYRKFVLATVAESEKIEFVSSRQNQVAFQIQEESWSSPITLSHSN